MKTKGFLKKLLDGEGGAVRKLGEEVDEDAFQKKLLELFPGFLDGNVGQVEDVVVVDTKAGLV